MKRNPSSARNASSAPPSGDWHQLLEKLREFRDARDWQQFHHPKDLAAAIAIEAGELQECFLWKTNAEIESELAKAKTFGNVVDELADVLIFVLLLADRLGIDVNHAVLAKIEANARKYPVSKAKGRSQKYTELRER